MLVKYFGQVAEITGIPEQEIEGEFRNTETFNVFIMEKYQGLKQLNYRISVNRKLDYTGKISANDEIALLPAFAGG